MVETKYYLSSFGSEAFKDVFDVVNNPQTSKVYIKSSEVGIMSDSFGHSPNILKFFTKTNAMKNTIKALYNPISEITSIEDLEERIKKLEANSLVVTELENKKRVLEIDNVSRVRIGELLYIDSDVATESGYPDKTMSILSDGLTYSNDNGLTLTRVYTNTDDDLTEQLIIKPQSALPERKPLFDDATGLINPELYDSSGGSGGGGELPKGLTFKDNILYIGDDTKDGGLVVNNLFALTGKAKGTDYGTSGDAVLLKKNATYYKTTKDKAKTVTRKTSKQ